jgi:hypothetical protein
LLNDLAEIMQAQEDMYGARRLYQRALSISEHDRATGDIESAENAKITVVMCLNGLAKDLPFSNYPSDGLYKEWCLLEFSDQNGGGVSKLMPDPSSLAVFRTNLVAWAAKSRNG